MKLSNVENEIEGIAFIVGVMLKCFRVLITNSKLFFNKKESTEKLSMRNVGTALSSKKIRIDHAHPECLAFFFSLSQHTTHYSHNSILKQAKPRRFRRKNMINLKGIEKSFDGNKVLKGINLDIKAGEVVALIGPSGTGKTTLLRTINFLEQADKGTITIDELTIDNEQATEKDIIEMRRQTAMVFQNYNLFRNKTVLENVMEGLVIVQKKSKEEAEKIARQEIDRVGMLDKVDQYPVELSGGQQQRIGIARAMALHPKVMLLDEPTSSLDPERSMEVLKVLQKVAKTGMTMIIATHEMDFAKYVSNHVVFMENGNIVEEGSPEQIFEHPTEDRTRQFVQELENPFA